MTDYTAFTTDSIARQAVEQASNVLEHEWDLAFIMCTDFDADTSAQRAASREAFESLVRCIDELARRAAEGRMAERADVVAWLDEIDVCHEIETELPDHPLNGARSVEYFCTATSVRNGEHVGAAEKARAGCGGEGG